MKLLSILSFIAVSVSPGVYHPTVTGTSGALSHVVPFTLTVTQPTTPTVYLSAFPGFSSETAGSSSAQFTVSAAPLARLYGARHFYDIRHSRPRHLRFIQPSDCDDQWIGRRIFYSNGGDAFFDSNGNSPDHLCSQYREWRFSSNGLSRLAKESQCHTLKLAECWIYSQP